MIEETEVDGVPTLVARATGPLRAGLTFRVGRADETLSRAGITHRRGGLWGSHTRFALCSLHVLVDQAVGDCLLIH